MALMGLVYLVVPVSVNSIVPMLEFTRNLEGLQRLQQGCEKPIGQECGGLRGRGPGRQVEIESVFRVRQLKQIGSAPGFKKRSMKLSHFRGYTAEIVSAL